MALPKLDREAYQNQMRTEFERVLQEVADAVDNAPQGRVIRDSEEQARDALDRFRKVAYEKAIQMKVNAAEAAFPPSAQRDHGEEETTQRKASCQPVDRKRTD
jgi:4-alpha-glucanotransferase